MSTRVLSEVLEATGYIANGEPAHGVYLDEDARAKCQAREFSPDALWRSESALTVYFKNEPEVPSEEQVARWHREIWNQGFAPLLWVVSPQKIELYNGFDRPRKPRDATRHRLRTFLRIEKELDDLNTYAGRLAMETGRFWQQASSVDRRTSVDRQLLVDLAALEHDLVTMGLDHSGAQGLIGRSIFTQYLIDREIITNQYLIDREIITNQIIDSEYGHRAFSKILRDSSATERLFDWLREIFNGDMFPSEVSTLPNSRYLRRVADFLEGVNSKTGQTTLFPYQFDVIPVELISSIYEQFAHAGDSFANTEAGNDVFYTRLPLVSLVLDEITEGLSGNETVIDLTCGSGVFLVEAFRRLVRLRSNGSNPDRELIRSTLHKQIYGVDISKSAVRVAAFSLYLAALELDPDPQPPQALKFKPLIDKTLIAADARNVESTLVGREIFTESGVPRKFDIIVGNPPWSYRGKSARAARLRTHNRNIPLSPRGESLDFVSGALRYASDKTRFGLILSAAQFFSQSKTGAAASHQLIEKLSPVTLVNLSNQSAWLFPRGNMPAMVLLARQRDSESDKITTVQIPWSPTSVQSHTFEIAPSDIIRLRLDDWQRRPAFLKAAFLGSNRDLSILDRLTSSHPTLGDQLRRLGTKLRTGLKFGDRSSDSSFLHGLPFVTKTDLRPLYIPDKLSLFDDERAERPRTRDIYKAPLLLIREFLTGGSRPIVAISDRDTVYMDAYFGVSLPSEMRETAYLLAAILSSSLASWFFLMTASAFGLWMRRLLLRDIELLPIPHLETALSSKAAWSLTQLISEMHKDPPSASDWKKLDDAVFDLYGMDEADRIVACDGLFRASWQWKAGKNASVKPANVRQLVTYANTFQEAIGVWFSAANQRRMRAEVFNLPDHAPLRVVRFVLEDCSKHPEPSGLEVLNPDGDLKEILNRIGDRLDVPLAKSLVGQCELRVHGHDEVVIIKPAARRHWMGVSALEDADSVIAESLSGPVL